MSYDHTVLDLSEIKLASIVGPNGAGKSTLLPLFDLILVISHVESVAQSIATVGNSIEISKVGNVSRLEVK